MDDGKTEGDWVVKVAMKLLSGEEERYGIGRDRLERLALSKLPATWRDRHEDERRILLMPDDYLISALKFSVRGAAARRGFRLSRYARPGDDLGGEAALDAFDAEFESVMKSGWRDHASPRLAALVLEARARGLPEAAEEWLSGYGDPFDAAETERALGVIADEAEKA